MRLDGYQRAEVRQSRTLGQTVQQALHLACLGPADLLTALAQEAEANPFVRLQPPARPTASGSPSPDRGAFEAEANQPSLIAHVLAQVDGLVPQREDRRLARALIEELTPTGYLAITVDQIAKRCGVPVARLEAVLNQMQRAEPAGLFARDLAECLALQLTDEAALTPAFAQLLARLPMIAAADRQELARQCGVSSGQLAEMLATLRRLNPHPGAGFGSEAAAVLIPELLVLRSPQGWEVQLNPDCQPRLSLDHTLWDRMRGTRSPDLAAAWTRAQHLATALDMRNRSVLAVGRCVVAHQAGALAGEVAEQTPLTRRMVAAEVGLHETTVGRIVKHAAARVEGRTVALSQYFGRQTASDARSGGVSQQRLLALIGDCLKAHGTERRVTDAAITDWLATRDITIARRTVAKYRHMLSQRA